MTTSTDPNGARPLLEAFSLEMTGRDVAGVLDASPLLPPGTRVNVTYLGTEDLSMRLAAVRAVHDAGHVPVPHLSARRMTSREDLVLYLGRLRDEGLSENVLVIGGDPAVPHGPFSDAQAVIATGLLPEYGVRRVAVAGYPEGHPDIAQVVLAKALVDKVRLLADQGLDGEIITQFGFDVPPVLAWVERLRDSGVDLPIRVGLPGPAGVKRLLAFAARFGVNASTGIARKYGLSLTNLMGTAGPDRFVHDLARGYVPSRHGSVGLHFYTFGGLVATSEWIRDFKEKL